MGKIGVLDFDGLAELYFESVQDWNDLISDEEFRKFTAGMLSSLVCHLSIRTY